MRIPVGFSGFTPDPSLLTSLIHSLPLNVYAKDVEGGFIFADNCYCAYTGKEHVEIIGRTDYDIHPGHMADKYREDDRRIMESRQAESIEEEHQSFGGKPSFVQVIKAPLLDASTPDRVSEPLASSGISRPKSKPRSNSRRSGTCSGR